MKNTTEGSEDINKASLRNKKQIDNTEFDLCLELLALMNSQSWTMQIGNKWEKQYMGKTNK